MGQGEVGGEPLWLTVHGGCCSWLQKGADQHCMAHSSAFLCKQAQKTVFHLVGALSGFLGSFQSGGVFLGRSDY